MPIGVNLLPWRETQARRQRQRLRLITVFAVLAGLMIMVAIAAPVTDRNLAERNRQSGLKARIAALEERVERAQRVDQEIDRLNARQSAMDRLQQRRTQAIDALTGVVAALPLPISLIRLEQQPNEFVIEGRSPRSAAIPTLIDALRAEPGFAAFRVQRLSNHPLESAPGQRFRLVLNRRPTALSDHDR